MKRLFLICVVAASVLAGCGPKDEPVDNTMPPAATKEAGEARASESGGGQFNRSSDRN